MEKEKLKEGTVTLDQINAVKDTLERAKQGILITAQGELIEQYFDRVKFDADVIKEIEKELAKLEAEFDAI